MLRLPALLVVGLVAGCGSGSGGQSTGRPTSDAGGEPTPSTVIENRRVQSIGSSARLIYDHAPLRVHFRHAQRRSDGAAVLSISILNQGDKAFDTSRMSVSEADRRHPVLATHGAEPCSSIHGPTIVEPGEKEFVCLVYRVRPRTRYLDFNDQRRDVALQIPRSQ